MIRRLLLLLLVSVFIFASYLTIYLGVFKDVEISKGPAPAFKLLYLDHVGPYHKIVPQIEKVETWAKAQGLECRLTFGQYLDDPSFVEHERLRSRGGCVVNEFPGSMAAEFKTLEIPAQDYIQASFSGSPAIGPYKVYSKVDEFAKKNNLQLSGITMEVYEVLSEKDMHTRYYFSLKTSP